MTTSFTARTPLDLIAVVPWLIGFHPADSVVLLTFGSARPFHARVDLPDHLDGQEQVAEMLHDVVVRHRASPVAVLLYTDDVAAADSQAEVLVERLLASDVAIIDVLRVDDECYHQVPATDAHGTPYDLSAHPFTAERVYAGDTVHRSREQLADSLVGTDADDVAAVLASATRFTDLRVAEVAKQPSAWLDEQTTFVRGLVRSVVRRRRRLGVHEAAQLLVCLSFPALRDVVMAQMSRGNAAGHVALWRDLVRRGPRDLLPGPAGLLAFSAWLHGDGALAWCAVDRCAEVDPDNPMAEIVAGLLERGVPPHDWVPMPEDEVDALGLSGRSARP